MCSNFGDLHDFMKMSSTSSTRRHVSLYKIFLFTVLLLTAVSGVRCLHEDEQGKYDWYRPGFGSATLAVFQPLSKSHTPSITVASAQSVVASFGLSSGALRWRHVFGQNETVRCLAASKTVVYAALDTSNTLYAIDANTGDILRSLALNEAPIGCGVTEETSARGGNLVVVGQGLSVTMVPLKIRELNRVNVLPSERLQAVGGGTDDGPALSAQVTGNGDVVALFRASIVVWSNGLEPVKTDLARSAEIKALEDHGQTPILRLPNPSCGTVTVASPNGVPLLLFDVGSHRVRLASGGDRTIITCDGENPSPTTPIALETSASGSVVYGSTTVGREKVGFAPRLLAARQTQDHNVEAVLASSGSTLHYLRFSLTDASGDFQVVSHWSYEGGLGEIATATFPDVGFTNDTSRVSRFGLNDRVVLASRSGMLFSLLTGDGRDRIDWSAFPVSDSTVQHPNIRQHSSVHVSALLSHGDTVDLRLQFDDESRTLVLLSYDALTGKFLRSFANPSKQVSVLLPASKAHVSIDGTVSHPYPHEQHYYVVHQASGTVEGFHVPANATRAVSSWLASFNTEIVAMASGSARLEAVASVENLRYLPNATSQETDIKRKYPTANVLVVCYYAKPTVELGDDDASILVVTAVDTITGQILGTLRHTDVVVGPVHITIAEHMVLYHFLDKPSMRYFVGVWEMFEHQDVPLQDSQYTSPALIAMSFFETRRTFSPALARPPQIRTNVIAFTSGSITALGVSVSKQGIARKQVVFVTTIGHVITVPLALLGIGALKEIPASSSGQLVPKDTLLVPSTSIVSYKYPVVGASRVFTAPTPLESTSHLLVVGLDMFYTRVSSGKPFDMIDEEFNYSALIGLCTALPVLSVVMRSIAQRRALKLAWA